MLTLIVYYNTHTHTHTHTYTQTHTHASVHLGTTFLAVTPMVWMAALGHVVSRTAPLSMVGPLLAGAAGGTSKITS